MNWIPVWKPHQVTGDRKGTWSLFVTKNWRISPSLACFNVETLQYP